MNVDTKKIIRLSEDGLSHRQIAAELGVSKTTVGYHLKRSVNQMENVLKAIVLPDTHISPDGLPQLHDKESQKAVDAYAKANGPWDYWIHLGDIGDWDFISKYTKENLRQLRGQTWRNQYRPINRFLDKQQELYGEDTKYVLLEGNHDYRVECVIDREPQLEGFAEIPLNLNLEGRGIRWIKSWSTGEVFNLGRAHFIHGNFYNINHAKTTVTKYGHSFFYGHTHDIMEYPWERMGDDDTIVAKSMGCLCTYAMKYMRGKPSKWQQGFGIFYIMPNGHFTYYTPRIIDHRFVGPDGKVYSND
jgi:hypothetical protein